MTEPNATPTRADVLREFENGIEHGKCNCGECVSELLAEEVLLLRAHRDAMIRRVEALPRYFPENEFDGVVMAMHFNGYWLRRVAVLAALREGGDDGQ